MHIFQSLGLRCAPFLREVMPHLLHALRRCAPARREALLLQLAALARIVRSHLDRFLPQVVDLVVDFWDAHTEQVARADQASRPS